MVLVPEPVAEPTGRWQKLSSYTQAMITMSEWCLYFGMVKFFGGETARSCCPDLKSIEQTCHGEL